MDFSKVTTPQRATLLISFMDIQGFLSIAQKVQDSLEVFDLLNGWAGVVTPIVSRAGGYLVKFIGDACLMIFPEDSVDKGVLGIMELKAASEKYFNQKGFSNKLRATAHFGEVVVGPFGVAPHQAVDVLGDTVNTAASLEKVDRRGQLIISPQAFRKLSPSTRKLFHKYTPPVVYIAEEQ
jgi:class 3 adenylate cyclase